MARIHLSAPDLAGTEVAMLTEAVASGWIAPLGPHVDAFEREMSARLEMPHALALSSGTAALHLALQVLGVVSGNEVWLSSLTFAATANAVRYVDAIPVFIDSDPRTWMIDPALLRLELDRAAATGTLPKAVITVDLYGHCADYEQIGAACRSHGVPLIEDAAEALGASYHGRPAGSFGELSILSFNGNKIITTSGGGMLLGRNKAHVDRARYLATQAREPARHYEHVTVGYNYRLSNLLAAVGRAQLADLDRRVAARRAIHARYRASLGDLLGWHFLTEQDGQAATHWLTCATIDPAIARASRDEVIDHLATDDIEARPVWKPMHLQPVFEGFPRRGGDHSAKLFEHGICLPSGSGMSAADVERVCSAVRRVCRQG
jgi:pyridoxal phosphate-dependent aminotransferase EpsN